MQRTVSIRWKILSGLLILSILPMLLLTYLFSGIASDQIGEQLELMADQAGRYIMLDASQTEDSLQEALEILTNDADLLAAIHEAKKTGDPQRLHNLLQHSRAQIGLAKLELIDIEGGHRHSASLDDNNGTAVVIPAQETASTGLSNTSSRIQIEDNRLAFTATAPVNIDGKQIASLKAFTYFDQNYADRLVEMTGADIAFHDGQKIITTSLEELKKSQRNLSAILDEDAVPMQLNGRPYSVYNYPLNHKTAGFLLAVDESAINEANYSMKATLVLSVFAVMTVAIILGLLFVRSLTRPIDSMVVSLRNIAEGEGDLTQQLKVNSNDEVGILAKHFNLFVERLRRIVASTRKASYGLIDATKAIRNRFSEVSQAADQQTRALEKTQQGIDEIGASSGQIADSVSNLVASVQQSAAATHELQSTTYSISEQMENLFGIISDISSSIHQLSSSNEQIDGNIIELSGNARETSKSAEELEQATSSIEQSALQTSQLAQQATTEALEGKAAVQDTIRGISELEQMMEQAYQTIQELGARSDAIGNIINVIDEVADQTNLLALNAAIIAAQAGEHGQGFAVVAEEIRNLAERTSVSTKEIAEIIENLQQGTQAAVSTIEAGTLRAQQEVARSAVAGKALEKLHASSLASTEQITSIAQETQKQSKENRTIVQAVLGITKMLEQIAISINQQTISTRNLSDAAESMKNIAARVKNSTSEQSRGSQQIAQSMEHIQQMIERIDDATRAQDERCKETVEAVAMVSQLAQENADRATGMDLIVENLLEHTALLRKEMGAFKIDEESEQPAASGGSD